MFIKLKTKDIENYIGSLQEQEILSSFKLEHIFECGQCFRWNKINNNHYIGIIYGYVIEIFEDEEGIHFYGSIKEEKQEKVSKRIKEIQNILIEYFDLNRDYNLLKKEILKNSDKKFYNEMKKAVEFGRGIRILNQEIFETILSFIISANNNIPRIKKIIENISQKYGKEIEYKNKKYYSFPDMKALKKVSEEEYRKLGAGFRDKRLYKTVQDINLNGLDEYISSKENLKKLSGIGDKVAECIMLFSLKKINTFPIDVWVRRVVNDIFFKYEDEKTLKREEIENFSKSFFGGYSGLAQQYLFYWRREK